MCSERRGCKIFNFRVGIGLKIANSVVIFFQRLQILHYSDVNSTMKTSNFTYIISVISSFCSLFKHTRHMPILNNRFVVMLWIWYPNNLHLSFFGSQTKMYLFVSWIVSNFYFCYFYELLQSYLLIRIWVEKIENWFCMLFLNFMFGLNKGKIVNKIL